MTINGKLYSNILLVFALESEAGKEFESFNKLFVGVEKLKRLIIYQKPFKNLSQIS